MKTYAEKDYPHKDLTEKIIAAAVEVQRVLGHGFTEPAYQEALEIELGLRGIPFAPQVEMKILYKDRVLEKSFRADFVIETRVIVEIKASSGLTEDDQSQLLNYLNAAKFRVGLLLNFGTRRLGIKRMVL